ncbi:hypothetical protein BdWA1_001228 [Babesia duncani]|uniref:Uncharacterized protein n=1 Tax=Babesia duncani TaxID=323732 RepID=A0AAD9UQU8_9APIC|nr:hypothetical protein BdWA1_003652 [Babesia duncani]KAK2198219.1 hypothetical protein BdWA1_001228 [Babesia duncani]
MAQESPNVSISEDIRQEYSILMSFHVSGISLRPWIMKYMDNKPVYIHWRLCTDGTQYNESINGNNGDLLLDWTSESFSLQKAKATNVDTAFIVAQIEAINKKKNILSNPVINIDIVINNVGTKSVLASAVCHVANCKVRSKLSMLTLKLKSKQGSFWGVIDLCYVSQQRWVKVSKQKLACFNKANKSNSDASTPSSIASAPSSARSDQNEEIMIFWNSQNTCFVRQHEKDYQLQMMYNFITTSNIVTSARTLSLISRTSSIVSSSNGSVRTQSILNPPYDSSRSFALPDSLGSISQSARVSITNELVNEESDAESDDSYYSKVSMTYISSQKSIEDDDIEHMLSQQNECIQSTLTKQFSITSDSNNRILYTKRTYSEDLLLNDETEDLRDVDNESIELLENCKSATGLGIDLSSTRDGSSGNGSIGMTEQEPPDCKKMVMRRTLADLTLERTVSTAKPSLDHMGQHSDASQSGYFVFDVTDEQEHDGSFDVYLSHLNVPPLPLRTTNYISYYEGYEESPIGLGGHIPSIDALTNQSDISTNLNVPASVRMSHVYEEMCNAAFKMCQRMIPRRRQDIAELKRATSLQIYESSWNEQFTSRTNEVIHIQDHDNVLLSKSNYTRAIYYILKSELQPIGLEYYYNTTSEDSEIQNLQAFLNDALDFKYQKVDTIPVLVTGLLKLLERHSENGVNVASRMNTIVVKHLGILGQDPNVRKEHISLFTTIALDVLIDQIHMEMDVKKGLLNSPIASSICDSSPSTFYGDYDVFEHVFARVNKSGNEESNSHDCENTNHDVDAIISRMSSDIKRLDSRQLCNISRFQSKSTKRRGCLAATEKLKSMAYEFFCGRSKL